jgi:hypothetical protein
VKSSVNTATRAPFEPAALVNSIGVSERMALNG